MKTPEGPFRTTRLRPQPAGHLGREPGDRQGQNMIDWSTTMYHAWKNVVTGIQVAYSQLVYFTLTCKGVRACLLACACVCVRVCARVRAFVCWHACVYAR